MSTLTMNKTIADFVDACRIAVNDFKDPTQRSLVRDALAAFDRAQLTKTVSSDDVADIVDAATCRSARVWDIGTSLLHWLAEDPVAQEALRSMLDSPHWSVRWRVVARLPYSFASRAFACELIRAGLCDRSRAVRGKSAEMAMRLRFRELLPDLRQADVDQKEKEFYIALLENGHLVHYDKGKATALYVLLDEGGWIFIPASDEKLVDPGLESLIAYARSRGEMFSEFVADIRPHLSGPDTS